MAGQQQSQKMTEKSERSGRENIREALLDAAGELMCEQDMIDISIVDIAARTGVNHAMICYYFGSKQGLMLALLERDINQALLRLRAVLCMDIKASEKMRLHLGGMIDTYYVKPYLNRLVQAMVRDAPDDRVRNISANLLKPVVHAQRMIIEQGIANGEFRNIDPMIFYFHTIGAADGLYSNGFTLQYVFGKSARPDKMLHSDNRAQIIDILMAGLLKNP